MLHQDILETRVGEPLFFGNPFTQDPKNDMYPARIHFGISEKHREGGRGVVYVLLGANEADGTDRYFFNSNNYEGATQKEVARMVYDLDKVYEYAGEPSRRWEDRPQAPEFKPVTDKRVLDSIEQCIVGFSKPQADRVILIKRDNRLCELTTNGKVPAPQYTA